MSDSLSQDIDEGREGSGGPVGDGQATEGMTVVASATDGLVIRGSVRDSLGVALPRAVVTLSGAAGGRNLAKTRSADDGAFSVIAPSHGEYLLAAFSPQLGSQSVTVRLAGRPVEVEFRITVPDSAPT